jgi:Ca-activated chloride channel family protein
VIAATLLAPWWWPALAVLPLLAFVVQRGESARALRRERQFGRRHEALLGAPVHGALRMACAWLATALVLVALLRPVWGEAPGEPAGPDVVVCLDVSRSMLARDVPPNRLGAAQRELEALAGAPGGGRLGLVAFAGEARLVAPLSADFASVAAIGATLDPSFARVGGSDLGAAIDVAAAALQRAGSAMGSIVVLTDGEDFAQRGRDAAQRARTAGLVVHCAGFGSASGSKIVVDSAAGETFLRDGAGHEVVSALDRDSLAAVAAAGGGTFVADGRGALLTLHETELRPRALAAALADPRLEPAHRFQWPLLAALLVWMLRSVMPERRRGAR